MKIGFHFPRTPLQRGFTLPEVIVAMGVSAIVMGGVILSHVTGLKMYDIVRSKLEASDATRFAVSLLIDEVRTAQSIKVGTATGPATTSFVAAADGVPQQGNALQIFPTTNSVPCIQYYLDVSEGRLCRSLNSGGVRMVVGHVNNSNAVVFRSEDWTGTVLTNNRDNRVIAVALRIYQLQFAAANVGTNQLADSYQFQTKISRRVL